MEWSSPRRQLGSTSGVPHFISEGGASGRHVAAWRAARITWTCSGPTTEGPSAPTGGTRCQQRRWNVPFRISEPNVVPAGGCVAGVARFAEHLDIFWADRRRGIASNYGRVRHCWGLARYGPISPTVSSTSMGARCSAGSRCRRRKRSSWRRTEGKNRRLHRRRGRQRRQRRRLLYGRRDSKHHRRLGSAGGRAILDPAAWTLGWAGHETGHCLGLDHSFDDSACQLQPRQRWPARRLQRRWDIMSFACYGGLNPMFASADTFGASGPGLNAPYRDKLGWIPGDRILELEAGHAFQGMVTLASLDKPAAIRPSHGQAVPVPGESEPGLHARVPSCQRLGSGHPRRCRSHPSGQRRTAYLIRQGGGPERRPGHHLDVFWRDSGAAIGSQLVGRSHRRRGVEHSIPDHGSERLPPVARVAAVSDVRTCSSVLGGQRGRHRDAVVERRRDKWRMGPASGLSHHQSERRTARRRRCRGRAATRSPRRVLGRQRWCDRNAMVEWPRGRTAPGTDTPRFGSPISASFRQAEASQRWRDTPSIWTCSGPTTAARSGHIGGMVRRQTEDGPPIRLPHHGSRHRAAWRSGGGRDTPPRSARRLLGGQ